MEPISFTFQGLSNPFLEGFAVTKKSNIEWNSILIKGCPGEEKTAQNEFVKFICHHDMSCDFEFEVSDVDIRSFGFWLDCILGIVLQANYLPANMDVVWHCIRFTDREKWNKVLQLSSCTMRSTRFYC